jgi:nitrite reductase/ring-hydroxylating ferredoxin subunit
VATFPHTASKLKLLPNVNLMLVRVGRASDIEPGLMRVFDVAGIMVNVANVDSHLYALEGTTVTCACHGSQFDVRSGAVLRGPAQRPERSRRVHVEGGNLLVEE